VQVVTGKHLLRVVSDFHCGEVTPCTGPVFVETPQRISGWGDVDDNMVSQFDYAVTGSLDCKSAT
jgi:hypothetical protein